MLAKSGVNPIKAREKERREAERNLHILSDMALVAFESRKAELKGYWKAGRWYSPLELHVMPKLGRIPVIEIDPRDIRDVLAPIWHTKSYTAKKALNRICIVLKHAAALGLDVDLQATEKAKALLGKSCHKITHVPALPWEDVPTFYQSLCDSDTVTHLALRLLILTGVRSAPLSFMHLDQVDGDTWTIPAAAMKGRVDADQDFRVPLSTEALNVMEKAKQQARDGFMFPSIRRSVISDATMGRYMKRAGFEARLHGFRTSIRTWLADCTDAHHEVAETVLSHVSGSKVMRSY